MPFAAVTVIVYAVPLTRSGTVIGPDVPVKAVRPPVLAGDNMTVYPVMALPPSDAGGEKFTVICESPGVAVTFCGAVGTVTGVTVPDGDAAGLVPKAFVAVTVIVYAVPFVRFVTVIGLEAPVAVNWFVPSLAVTVYPMTAPPFVCAGGSKVTVACVSPAAAVTF